MYGVRTFLRESIKCVGGGVGGEKVAAFDHILFVNESPLGSDGSFDAVPLSNEEIPPENLGEAVHHVVELLLLHVHQRARREPKLRHLRRRVVPHAVSVEQLL